MRPAVISFLILMGCGREDPAIEIVRLPQTAYGPFDAAAAKPVASDGGTDSGPKNIPTTQIECYVPTEALGEDEESADAPFDNCPAQHGGGRFNEKATSQRRARNTDMCCYTVVHRKAKVITLPPIGISRGALPGVLAKVVAARSVVAARPLPPPTFLAQCAMA